MYFISAFYQYEIHVSREACFSKKPTFSFIIASSTQIFQCLKTRLHIVFTIIQFYYFYYFTKLIFSGSHQNNIGGKEYALSYSSSPGNRSYHAFALEDYSAIHSPTHIVQQDGVSDFYKNNIRKHNLHNAKEYTENAVEHASRKGKGNIVNILKCRMGELSELTDIISRFY